MGWLSGACDPDDPPPVVIVSTAKEGPNGEPGRMVWTDTGSGPGREAWEPDPDGEGRAADPE